MDDYISKPIQVEELIKVIEMYRLGARQHAVEPVWPKVRSEHPELPDPLPTPNPNPRGVNPSGLWFLIISRAVSGLTALPRAPRNSPRNRARSGAEACVPPQGAPSFRQ